MRTVFLIARRDYGGSELTKRFNTLYAFSNLDWHTQRECDSMLSKGFWYIEFIFLQSFYDTL